MKTQLIIFYRPNRAQFEDISSDIPGSDYRFLGNSNLNQYISRGLIEITRPANLNSGQGFGIDLYEDVSIPITFSILDIREPEKRKTSWSKTITIPGTKNNNRVFTHIYEIGQDGWFTINGKSYYEAFNPNLRLEVILLQDGIQVMKGNLQMKKIRRDKDGNIEYDIALNGDLTSLFYDVGDAKLADLDFSEYDHAWTKTNIENSWAGLSIKSDDTILTSISNGANKVINRIGRHTDGRLKIRTTTTHGLVQDDSVYLDMFTGTYNNVAYYAYGFVKGEFLVTDVISSTEFVVNYWYPTFFNGYGDTYSIITNAGYQSYAYKRTATGKGYVYPMISWGEEYDHNSFPVTSFVPGVYIKDIFDKIMSKTNSKYQSNFLDSQFFKRLILIQKKKEYELNLAQVKERKFSVGLTQSYTTGASYRLANGFTSFMALGAQYANFDPTTLFSSKVQNRVVFKKEDMSSGTVSFYDYGPEGFGNWDQSGYKWTVRHTGEYQLQASLIVSAWVQMNGFKGESANGTASFNPVVPANATVAPSPAYFPGAISNPSNSNWLGEATTGLALKIRLKRSRNGVISVLNETLQTFKMNSGGFWTPTNSNWKYFGRYQPQTWENLAINITSNDVYFQENDECWLEVEQYVQANVGSWSNVNTRGCGVGFFEVTRQQVAGPGGGGMQILRKEINGEFFYTIHASSFIFNTPSTKSVEGSVLNMVNVLPKDMTCKDFLLSIIKSFNLHIEPDKQIERLYYIEPRDSYYKTGSGGASDYVDWSQKVDYESLEIIPMGELIAKYYTFENKDESDYWNKKFKEDRGRAYMYYQKEVNNDFLKNEVKISIPFGSTVMINNPEQSDVVMPAIIQRESNGAAKPVTNSLPRMLYWGGMRPYTALRGQALIKIENPAYGLNYGWELLSGSQSAVISASSSLYQTYPYAGTVDCPQDPVYDLNWYNMEVGDFVYWDNARWTNENLYNKYWSNFINEVSDPASKVIVANLRLTPKDIYNLDFRKIYVIDNNYLRLQKIYDYDPVVDGLTKCEFLKLKSPSKFTRRSQITDWNGISDPVFAAVPNNDRPLQYTTLELAPIKKKPDFGFVNTTPGTELSNTLSIVTNGLSNVVASDSKNVKINGNENSIGNSTQNIHISSGNGNFIVGGAKNVTLIGTDKRYVVESDVTYINNIRYKNGVPISKSNVINGGIDVAVVRQSISTTINVINGSEDVVISGGTSTYENVINSGIDTILPDVSELGISTTVNPNPRTNAAGPYQLALGTQSLAQAVRTITYNSSFS